MTPAGHDIPRLGKECIPVSKNSFVVNFVSCHLLLICYEYVID